MNIEYRLDEYIDEDMNHKYMSLKGFIRDDSNDGKVYINYILLPTMVKTDNKMLQKAKKLLKNLMEEDIRLTKKYQQ